jgi:hypothetical protein
MRPPLDVVLRAPRLAGRGLIQAYRHTLSPLIGLDLVPPALPEECRWYMPWRYGRWRGTNAVAAPEHPPPP